MSDAYTMIPPPPIVRDRLAETIREERLLRSLLRLSLRAAEARNDRTSDQPHTHEAAGQGVARA